MAARRSGMTLGEWLNSTILEQVDESSEGAPVAALPLPETRSATELERTASRLEDIAEHLAKLARRDQDTAPAFDTGSAAYQGGSAEAMHRLLARVESNERQTVEAFTAVNDRLAVIGKQIAQVARPRAEERLEDRPSFVALEKAVRNIVEHMEMSEKRNRDNFKSLQDRLATMSAKAAAAPQDQVLRQAPAFTQLESRLADLVRRVESSESNRPPADLPELLRREMAELAKRIDTVRETAEVLANRAQTQAVQASQQELRAIEQRIAGLMREAQSSLAGNMAGPVEIQRLRGEIERLNARIDEASSAKASGTDVLALRQAVEQLSSRMAQEPDPRPLADMDRRIVDLSQRLERTQAETRNLPQLGELEHRLAELDHKLNEALSGQSAAAAAELEERLSDIAGRVENTERHLASIETIERAITQLFDSIEQQKEWTRQIAIDAAETAAARLAQHLAPQAQPVSLAGAPEIESLRQGLHAVRASADAADQRNQETLEAVHETLEQIVTKLTELEAAPAQQPAMNASLPEMPGMFAAVQQDLEPEPEPLPDWHAATHHPDAPPAPQMGEAPPTFATASPVEAQEAIADAQPQGSNAFDATIQAGREAMQAGAVQAESDDFIAAARRAAQASFQPKSILSAVAPELARASEEGSRKLLSFSFLHRGGATTRKKNPGLTGEIAYPPGYKPAANENGAKKRRLLVMGLCLLLVASAFTFNMMNGTRKAKVPAAPAAVEQPLKPPAATGAEPDADLGAVGEDTESEAGANSANPPPAELESRHDSAPVDNILTSSTAPPSRPDDLAALIAGESPLAGQAPAVEVGSAALREAAAMGNARAQFVIATRYLNGEQGVPQDEARAAYWYERAAAQGLAPAQYRLGTLFERGRGVARDLGAALAWYERAASLGNVKAMHNAAVLAASTEGQQADYGKAYRWFSLGAAHGLKDSQFNLAVLLERGLGTRANPAEALFWYAAAAAQKDEEAARRAATLAKVLGAGTEAAVRARLTAWKADAPPAAANVVSVNEPGWNASGSTG
jgi:localization factor PodJL